MKPSTLTLLPILLAASLLGCAADQPAAVEAAPAAATTPVQAAPAAVAAGVTFEPAFPADVSADPLTTKDVEQQTAHSHDGGEAHKHDEAAEEGHGDHGHPH